MSNCMKMALAKVGYKSVDLAKAWNVTLGAVTNKFYRDSWSAEDIASVAKVTGGKLVIKYPDGQEIVLPAEDVPRKIAAAKKESDQPED